MDLFFVLLLNDTISLNRDNKHQLCFETVYEHTTSLLRPLGRPKGLSNEAFGHVVNCT